MGKMSMEDFIRYAKEQFGVDVTLEKTETPDTFETLFGDLTLDNSEILNTYEEQLVYNNENIQVNLMMSEEEQNKYSFTLGFAA